MAFLIRAAETVQMGNQPVKQVYAHSTGKNAHNCGHQTPFSTVVQRG